IQALRQDLQECLGVRRENRASPKTFLGHRPPQRSPKHSERAHGFGSGESFGTRISVSNLAVSVPSSLRDMLPRNTDTGSRHTLPELATLSRVLVCGRVPDRLELRAD